MNLKTRIEKKNRAKEETKANDEENDCQSRGIVQIFLFFIDSTPFALI